MIYFIENLNNGLVKIGHTNRPRQRFKSLKYAEKSDLLILGVMDGDVVIEREMHAKFRSSRIRGEWFEKTPELRLFIASSAFFKMPDDYATGTKRLSITVEDDVAAEIERLRLIERRPESNMVALLITEALQLRKLGPPKNWVPIPTPMAAS